MNLHIQSCTQWYEDALVQVGYRYGGTQRSPITIQVLSVHPFIVHRSEAGYL